MKKSELYERTVAYFQEAMPTAETELHYDSHFQLLVAVILSAQCTDRRVNQTTPRLFSDYPTAEAMAEATPEVIYEYIKSVSYPNSKARHLVDMARMLLRDFQGIVPDTLEELIKLPGVGRKTANVIQAVAFDKAAMAVDTHVFRVAHRIGLVSPKCTTPYAVERALMKGLTQLSKQQGIAPESLIPRAHHWLILHGRYICQARKPKCEHCGLLGTCQRKFDYTLLST